MFLIQVIKEYRELQSKLVGDVGNEECPIHASWNDCVLYDMEDLLNKSLGDEVIKQKIRLNHI
jgi:hypothetical protein